MKTKMCEHCGIVEIKEYYKLCNGCSIANRKSCEQCGLRIYSQGKRFCNRKCWGKYLKAHPVPNFLKRNSDSELKDVRAAKQPLKNIVGTLKRYSVPKVRFEEYLKICKESERRSGYTK